MTRTRRALALLLNWIHQVALSVWLGGIVGAGALGAAAIFRTAKAAGHTQRGMPLFDFAGTAAQSVFARLNVLALVAGILLLVTGLLYPRLVGLCWTRTRVRAGLTAVALGIEAYLMFGMFNRMAAMRLAGQMAEFDVMHRLYEAGFQAQIFLLLGVAAMTGWMHLDHATAVEEARESAAGLTPARQA